MTTAAQDLVALLEGAELWVRMQVVLFLQFPQVMAVETGSTSRAHALLERYGVEPGTMAPVMPLVPPAAPVQAAQKAPKAMETFEDLDAIDVLDDLDVLDEIEAIDELEPVAVPDAPEPLAPVGMAPQAFVDPEATELDMSYEDEQTVATRLDDLPAVPEDSMDEDPATLGDPDETEDLLREPLAEEDTQTPVSAAVPAIEELDEVAIEDLDEIEELDADAIDELTPIEDDDIVEIEDDAVEPVDLDLEEVEIDDAPGGDDLMELDDDAIEIEDDTPVAADDEVEIELDVDAGEDALVTMEDTADPRSDLEGLSRFGDSDLDDDPILSDEVVVRKDGAVEGRTPRMMESDLPPDEEETFVADLADIEKMKAKMGEDTGDDASNSEVMVPRPKTPEQASPRERTSPRVAAGPRAVAAAGVAGAGGVTAGLYGNPNVPQIRDRAGPRPAAAAIQIDQAMETANQGGSGSSVLEDEELLALGSSEDYGEDELDVEPGAGGFAVEMQEYEDEEEFEEEDDVDLGEPEEAVPLVPLDAGTNPAEVARLFKAAEDAVEEGDLEAAIDFYSDVIDLDPENADCHVKRGRLYLDYGDYSRAMSDFMLSEELQPASPEPQVAVGDLYFARKDYNRAIEYFNRALDMDPNHAMAFCRRGISHYYRKNYRDALEDLNKAQKLDADIPNIRTYIAMAKKKAKR